MSETEIRNRLDRPVDHSSDHVLGAPNAPITLVEYGSYACPYCRAANERIAEVRDQLGERLRYVFRHKPLTNNDLARRAAELAEQAQDAGRFWEAHIKLMTRSETLTEDDLRVVADELNLDGEMHRTQEQALTARRQAEFTAQDQARTPVPESTSSPIPQRQDAAQAAVVRRARERVEADERSARASGALYTPAFFINGRHYDGPWDESSFQDALFGSLGHRVRSAALDFASWAPSAGILLLLTTIMAVAFSNSMFGHDFEQFWEQSWGFNFGRLGFGMPLLHWINDALLTVFFLVVGLEIKREFTVGRLASKRSAALPIAAAIGGMVAPALLYSLVVPDGPWARGWGVPMATDTAFAVALIAMMGKRVPVELRVFLTAAAIVDDIGSIIVVALFYSGELHLGYLAAAAVITVLLALLNRARVYRATPYVLVGIALWACVHAGGLHATLAGVLLALFIPTRPPANLKALMTQANAIVIAEASHGEEVLRHGPSVPALRALDAIHDRLESPADRLLRHVAPRSSYIVLPLFALANAGVAMAADAFNGHSLLMLAIVCGLFIGKPLGLVLACVLAVKLGLAVKPNEYSWRQLVGAGALAGIGFTMSLFIAAQAFPMPNDFAAAKIAVFAASVLSAVAGVAILWTARAPEETEVPTS